MWKQKKKKKKQNSRNNVWREKNTFTKKKEKKKRLQCTENLKPVPANSTRIKPYGEKTKKEVGR